MQEEVVPSRAADPEPEVHDAPSPAPVQPSPRPLQVLDLGEDLPVGAVCDPDDPDCEAGSPVE